jgi:flagellar biosynthetic protein FliO
MEWVLVKTLFSLVAVLGLMIGVVFLLKKFVYGSGAPSSAQVEIKVIGSRSLSPKKSISVVRVMGKVLVVGLSEQGMSLLTELDSEEASGTTGEPSPASTRNDFGMIKSGPFITHLGRSLARLIAKDQKAEGKSESMPGAIAPVEQGTPIGAATGQRRRKSRSNYA